MNRRCSNENCFPDTTCALGHIDRENCEHWNKQEVIEEESTEFKGDPTSDVPWNGYVLGTSDLAILSGRGRPYVIGLVGPPNSGKTSLLAYVYMWLLKHGKMCDWNFAGSWTIGGWESVVQYCRWTGEPPPSFPPHTSSSGRHPGVLHVTLRRESSSTIRDVMFTDAPGEWFTQWSRVPKDPGADGARWVIDHSDVLIMLIDSEALADAEKLPQARREARDLIERVGAESAQQPVIVVWSKSDIEVPGLVRDGLQRSLNEFLPDADVRSTTIYEPETIVQCFVHAIVAAEGVAFPLDTTEPPQSHDPFLAFRGIHVNV